MPEVAIDCFYKQTYPHKKLLIINHGNRDFGIGDDMKEVKITKTPDMHVGALRNIAFDYADSNYLMTFDDDDWRHPDAMEYQAINTPDGRMSILKYRIHHDLLTRDAFVHDTVVGGGNSMLYPRNADNRYRNWRNNSDGWFRCMFPDKVLLNNPPEYYIMNCHGKNLTQGHQISTRCPLDLELEEFQKVLVEKVRGLYKPSKEEDK